MTLRALHLALPLVCLGAIELPAQGVRGVVVQPDSATPAQGIVVLLVDGNNRVAARALSTSRGAFHLNVVGAGSYTLRALRIGYRPTDVGPLTLTTDSAHNVRVVLRNEPLALETVSVAGRHSCQDTRDGSAVAAAWLQARTALTAAAITASSDGYLSRYATWERVADPKDSTVTYQRSQVAEVRRPRVFASAPADSLATVGYVFEDRGSMVFLGPDAEVLLSDQFAASHCFKLAPAPDGDASGIAIEFTPTGRRGKAVDVKGRLVLDRATSELRSLDFSYDGLPRNVTEQMAGGRVLFTRVPDGAWIVSYWALRIPSVVLEGTEGFMDRARMRVQEVRETGGAMLEIRRDSSAVWRGVERRVAGRLVDDQGVPPANGRVQLEGTAIHTSVDADGRFVLEGLLPGRYALLGASASLDSLGMPTRVGVVDVREKDLTEGTFSLPSPADVYRTVCRREEEGAKNATGLLRGFVVDGRGVGVAGATVRVQFMDADTVGTKIVKYQGRNLMIEAGPDGSFNYCRVPRGMRLKLTPIVNDVPGKVTDALLPLDRAYVVVELRAP